MAAHVSSIKKDDNIEEDVILERCYVSVQIIFIFRYDLHMTEQKLETIA